ncbi:TetR/AcrR family transcriptional regulator [Nocardia sp. NPDC048505]|uniref:TetR/AcrR family transcriptional regulator n=1 Tax=unclassified Nocardia TaxID=2637762 RepID=UPI003405B480
MSTRSAAGPPDSRDQLLDAAERLMSAKGYAGTPVSAICKAAQVAPTSLYWHFGSKEGILAAVMARGAQRWFDALPRWDESAPASEPVEALIARGAAAVSAHPIFLRLFYLLVLDGAADATVGGLVRQVREQARAYFAEAITAVLTVTAGAEVARVAAAELTRFALAFSDGCFFATQLEPDEADLVRMYGDLATALVALAPAAIARARTATPTETTPAQRDSVR